MRIKIVAAEVGVAGAGVGAGAGGELGIMARVVVVEAVALAVPCGRPGTFRGRGYVAVVPSS